MPTLDEILRQFPAESRPTEIESLGSAGGMSGAQFWRITAPRGTLVLRRWPVEHPTADRLEFIHAVLAYAAKRGIAVLPVPIAMSNGQTFFHHAGHLWQLEPWMPGAADYARAPIEGKLRAAMIALAQFHVAVRDFPHPSIASSEGGSTAVMDRLTRLQDLAHGGREELASTITDRMWPNLAPVARQFLAALPRALPRAIALHEPLANVSFSLQPCIRDIWHDHVLFTGERVTGIIDFGAMDVDTPACDVARLLGGLVGPDADNRQIGLAAYTSVRLLSAQELQAVAAFDTSIVLLAGCNWIRWIYADRRDFDDLAQVTEHFRRIAFRAESI